MTLKDVMRRETLMPLYPFPAARLTGIEIEVEGWEGSDERYDDYDEDEVDRDVSDPDGWTSLHDGSLRGGGREFITAPSPLCTVPALADNFYRAYRYEGWEASQRTSTHVHVDVRDLTAEELKTSLVVYTLLEGLLFKQVDNSREHNVYCVPYYRAWEDLARVSRFLRNPIRNASCLGRTCKYSALYLEPILRFGTIEFRHAHTFATASELVRWVNICHAVAGAGTRMSIESVLRTVDTGGITALANEVFGELDVAVTLRDEEAIVDMDVFHIVELLLGYTDNLVYENHWIPDLSETDERRVATSVE